MDSFYDIKDSEEVKKLLTFVKIDKQTPEYIEFGSVFDGFSHRYYRIRANGKVQVQSMNATSWTTWAGSSIPVNSSFEETVKCLKRNIQYLLDKIEQDVQFGKIQLVAREESAGLLKSFHYDGSVANY